MSKLNDKVITYRPDIDGLRAIAVVAVLFFHFYPELFKGGFVGVDVFFVISGYLVTSIISNNILSGKFLFSTFYVKRIQRLFPSLIVVLASCLVFGGFFLNSDEFESLGKHILGGATFFENVLLYSESGYFDKRSDFKPLLHLWSLSIEEQFYFIWPLVLFFGYKKGKRALVKILGCIFIISFLLNIFLARDYQSLTFYLLPTRLWELASGGLLIFFERNFVFRKFLDKINSKLSFFFVDLSFIGIILITTAFLFYNKDKYLPGIWIIISVFGTMLLILADPKSKINSLLSNKYIVYVGLISYPLYLWHWPLASFSHIIYLSSVSSGDKFFLILASFVLAIITYEWVEKPIRNSSISYMFPYVLTILLTIVAFSGFIIFKSEGYPERYPSIEIIRKSKAAFVSTEKVEDSKKCMEKYLKFEMCAISKINENPTVVLIGDSHANHLFPGLKKFYDKKGENLLLLARSGTAPFYKSVSKREPLVSKDESLEDVFNFISKNASIKTVILSAFWTNYFEEEGVFVADYRYKNIIEDSLDPAIKNQSHVFHNSLKRTIEHLQSQDRQVIFIYDIPYLSFYPEQCLPRPIIKTNKKCDFSIADELKKQEKYKEAVGSVVKKNSSVITYDPLSIICDSKTSGQECSIFRNGKIIYSDEHHLSIYGSEFLIDRLF